MELVVKLSQFVILPISARHLACVKRCILLHVVFDFRPLVLRWKPWALPSLNRNLFTWTPDSNISPRKALRSPKILSSLSMTLAEALNGSLNTPTFYRVLKNDVDCALFGAVRFVGFSVLGSDVFGFIFYNLTL